MKACDGRAESNRRNAQKSTGPRTEAGKARSRANAFIHGLAGQGVAWPGEEAGRVEAFVERQVATDDPADDRERWLARRTGVLMWQIDRADRLEALAAHAGAERGREAELERRDDQVERWVDLLPENPSRAVRSLLRTAEGCDWILNALAELIDAVEADWWLPSFDDRLDALCAPGLPGKLRITRAKALSLAIGSTNWEGIWPNGVPGLEPLPLDADDAQSLERFRLERQIARQHRPAWLAELKAILARRKAEIEGRRDQLRQGRDTALAHAEELASLDLTTEGERRRRYLRSRERERRDLVRELDARRASRSGHDQDEDQDHEAGPERQPDTPGTQGAPPEPDAAAAPGLPPVPAPPEPEPEPLPASEPGQALSQSSTLRGDRVYASLMRRRGWR